MAEVEYNSEHTLIEVVKRHDPDGKMARIVDILSKKNPLLEEGYWEEANDFTSHVFTQVLTEPVGTVSRENEGVAYETSTTRQVREELCMLESYNRIDVRILRRVRNAEEYRRENNKIHLRGLAKTFHALTLYGNLTDPKEPRGWATRYNNNTTYGNVNLQLAGGANNVTSIWVVKWGLDGVYFAYPRGGKKFIEEEDLGKQLIHDNNSKPYTAVVSHFIIQFGVCVADDRCIQRIANVEMSGNYSFNADQLITALNRLPDLDNVVIYVNKNIKNRMDIAAQNKTNVNYTKETVWGVPTTMFQQIPVRPMEALLQNETVVA